MRSTTLSGYVCSTATSVICWERSRLTTFHSFPRALRVWVVGTALIATLCFSTATHSHAAVIERDWLAPGDGLLTYDDVNKREWLDLNVSHLVDFDGGNIEEKFQAVLAETLPGGRFEGFVIAKSEEALSLAASAGIDVSTNDFDTNKHEVLHLIDLLGLANVSSNGRVISHAVIDGFSIHPAVRDALNIDYYPRATLEASHAEVWIGPSDGVTSQRAGVALYRSTIPEPATRFLVTVVCLLAASRKCCCGLTSLKPF